MYFPAFLRPHPSSNALIAPAADFSSLKMASSPKRRALEFLRQKLNTTKELQKEKYYRGRFLDSSPPPPLGQASGPVDERIRTDLWSDEYGFDDGDHDLDAGISLAHELDSDSPYYVNPSRSTYDQSRANSTAHVTTPPTSRRTSCASIVSDADAPSVSDLYGSGLEYCITSISDTSVFSDGASFLDDGSIISSSISSHSSPGNRVTETVGRISVSHEEDSSIASGAYGNGGDELPETCSDDTWSILSANERLAEVGEDALNAHHMGYAAATASTSVESVAVNEDFEAQSSPAPLATTPQLLRIHPLFAAMYGNDPNWAFWPRDDIRIGHVHEETLYS